MWNAYVGDPTRRHLFQQQMADPRYGLKLDDNPVAPIQDTALKPAGTAPIAPMPANLKAVGGDPALWDNGYNEDDRAFFIDRAAKAAAGAQ
jgi:hypothetical protein